MMPVNQTEKNPDVTIISDSQSSQAEEPPLTDNTDTEITVTADIKYNTDETVAKSEKSQTPEILPPVSCSTELAQHRTNKDPDQTPTGSPQKSPNSVNKDPKPKSQKKIVHFIRNTANKQKAGNKNA